MSLQKSVQAGILRPFRKCGLAIARSWPWPVAARMRTGRKMYVDLRSAIGRSIYMKGEFDPRVFDAIAGRLKPGNIFLDVGANVGYYSMRALDLVGDAGAVHSFEIDPRPLLCLRKSIRKAGLKNIFLHEQAVGDRNGSAFLFGGNDCGHSRVSKEGTGPSVPMITLDRWRERYPEGAIQAIKLDVEGGELQVLQGAINLLRQERPLLVCEVIENDQNSPHKRREALFGILQTAGYKWRWIEGCNDPTLAAEQVG